MTTLPPQDSVFRNNADGIDGIYGVHTFTNPAQLRIGRWEHDDAHLFPSIERHVVERCDYFVMVRPQCLLKNANGAGVKILCFRVLTLQTMGACWATSYFLGTVFAGIPLLVQV